MRHMAKTPEKRRPDATRFTLILDKALDARVAKEAQRRGISKNLLLREGVELALEQKGIVSRLKRVEAAIR